MATRSRPAGTAGPAPAWYVAEGERGQRLLEQGDAAGAAEVFGGILARLGDVPSFGRAVMLGRLGRCRFIGGDPEAAVLCLREAIGLTGRLPPSDGVKRLRGTLRSELGDAHRAAGRTAEARKAYAAALEIAETLGDRAAQALELERLGSLALADSRLDESLSRYRAALLLAQQLGDGALEAIAWQQLGRVLQASGQLEEAERHYLEAAHAAERRRDAAGAARSWAQVGALARSLARLDVAERWYSKAIEADRRSGEPLQLSRHLTELAGLLREDGSRLEDAVRAAAEAVSAAQAHAPLAPEVWKGYGVLGEILERQAAGAEEARGTQLRATGHAYRQLGTHVPRLLASLARLGEGAGFGRAVLLGRLGQSLQVGGRPDLAAESVQQALRVLGEPEPGDDSHAALRGALQAELGGLLVVLGRYPEARSAHEHALAAARTAGDLMGEGGILARLGGLALAEGELETALAHYRAAVECAVRLHDPAVEAAARRQLAAVLEQAGRPPEEPPVGAVSPDEVEVRLSEEVAAEYAIEPDLLIDGPRERRCAAVAAAEPLPGDLVPALRLGTRTWVDEDGSVVLAPPAEEPGCERQPGCVVMRRTRRETRVTGAGETLWRMVRGMDGTRTVAAVLAGLPAGEVLTGTSLLASLAVAGVVDTSGRPVGRFLHTATKKGVLPGGGLAGEEVLRWATEGSYRSHPDAPRLPVDAQVPERLRPFHALTRARRSSRDYTGRGLVRREFDALLHTACGVTGAMAWEGREVKLRAYPSSGALYAVEVYPLVLRVEGLEPGVYHYRAADNLLEVVRPELDRTGVVAAALPVERAMVDGAAALLCLTGVFPRHERKYGAGGYRMLVAEAGHLSQNLILAATALGLSARPFGGVFDDLLNHDLGLDPAQEQFLLAVLVGHTGGTQGGKSR